VNFSRKTLIGLQRSFYLKTYTSETGNAKKHTQADGNIKSGNLHQAGASWYFKFQPRYS
jgi:hypothetical protein